MKLNQSLAVRTAGTMAASQATQRITGVLAKYRTSFALVAVVVATVVGIALWNAARPVAPAAPAADSQSLSTEDIATLPWQIHNQVAGTDRGATGAVVPSSHELRPEYIATLPAQIQSQLQGSTTTTSSGLRPEYIVTLPHQIQAQVAGQGALPAHAATRLAPEDVRTLPWQIQEQVR
jgi:hypothetical protein